VIACDRLLKNARRRPPKANPQEIAAFKERAGTLESFVIDSRAESLRAGWRHDLSTQSFRQSARPRDGRSAIWRGATKRGACRILSAPVKFADDWVDAAQARFDEAAMSIRRSIGPRGSMAINARCETKLELIRLEKSLDK